MSIYKSLTALALIASTSLNAQLVEARRPYLLHTNEGFALVTAEGMKQINKWDMDKSLRDMSPEDLQSAMKLGAYLTLKKMSNDDLSLNIDGRINGGGPIGTWVGAIGGKLAVNFVCHGAIHLVSLATGPLYVPTAAALTYTFAIPIEAASNAGAVAGAITMGVATGPV